MPNKEPQFYDTSLPITESSSDPFSPESQKEQLLIQEGTELIDRLRACPYGRPGWQEFEDICYEILKFCLHDVMESFDIDKQGTTWDNHQRMDIIVKNRPYQDAVSGYWNGLKTNYQAESILFECKNYKKGIKKEEVLQAKDYNLPEFGRFRVILTRKLPSKSGILAIHHWFNYDPRIRIVVFTEDDLIRLVQAKVAILDLSIENVFYSIEDKERSVWYR